MPFLEFYFELFLDFRILAKNCTFRLNYCKTTEIGDVFPGREAKKKHDYVSVTVILLNV